MSWVSFQDKAAFVAYHNQACTDRGIPRPGRNQKTGLEALDAQWTVAWVRPIVHDGILKAVVPDEDVAVYKLTLTSAPPERQSISDPPVATKTAFDAELDKALPDTWDGKPVPTRASKAA